VETRPLRADARRNRDRLLAVAVAALSEDGPDVPLDAIARAAGVGIGTLYRHFPTRDALVEAAYRTELDKLCAVAPALLADRPADAALRSWMDRFVDYIAAKRGMAAALKALIAGGGNPYAHSRDRMLAAVDTLLAAGVTAGTLRPDVTAADVLTGISGITLATDERDQAARLLDLLLDALRPR
jgi:AcrR family transcriptional regulator